MPSVRTGPFALWVEFDKRDLARFNKRLDKWQGKPLETRLRKAVEAGARLLVNPIKAHAPRRTGGLRSSTKPSKSIKSRDGWITVRVGPTKRVPDKNRTALLTALLVYGANGAEPNPFIDAAVKPLEPAVQQFIDTQVRRLA